MNHLVDTNILTRLAEPGHPMHQPALDAVKRLVSEGHELPIVPQILHEFWVVCTRPTAVNGLGKTAAEAARELASLKGLFRLLDETPAIHRMWEGLVISTPVVGKNGQDARLVAAIPLSTGLGLGRLAAPTARGGPAGSGPADWRVGGPAGSGSGQSRSWASGPSRSRRSMERSRDESILQIAQP